MVWLYDHCKLGTSLLSNPVFFLFLLGEGTSLYSDAYQYIMLSPRPILKKKEYVCICLSVPIFLKNGKHRKLNQTP